MIIGVCGLKGNGKDTIADMISSYGYTKISMAGTLKDVVSSLFGWSREMLEGDTVESREWREIPDRRWSGLVGRGIFKNDTYISPRIALQRVGTDLIRKHICDDFFIMKIGNLSNVVIPDIRFSNEIEMCDITINVIRNEYSQKEIEQMHESETIHLKHDHTYTVYNDGTLGDLEKKVRHIMLEL